MPLYPDLIRAFARRRILFLVLVLSLPLTFAVMSFLIVKVVPHFAEVFDSFGKELPPLTQLVVGVSRDYPHYMLLTWTWISGLALALYLFTRVREGRALVDAVLLKMPLLGALMRQLGLARFSMTLAGLAKAGMPDAEALDKASNAALGALPVRAKSGLRAGKDLNGALEAAGLDFLGVQGEGGARLMALSQAYAKKAEDGTLLPGLLLAIGLVVLMGIAAGTVVIAMYLPMFELGNLVGE